ncbi:cation-translocating P-type ATPase [Actinomycetaceae bacterium L2_0104]
MVASITTQGTGPKNNTARHVAALRRWLRSSWTVPALSGGLIISSWLTPLPTVSNLLMITAAAVAGTPVIIKAVRALRAGAVGIDLLVSVAVIGAIVIAEYWEAAAVTFLFSVGHALETATLARTRAALSDLISVAPDTAVIVRDGRHTEVPVHEVRVDDVVVVKNGAKVPVDGVVVAGTASMDESSITGESIPVEKTESDQVYAGTISLGGLIQVRTTGAGSDTTLARVIRRVEEAQDAKAPTARFMDRFAAWYTPAIILGALVAGLLTSDVELALTLLVIGCPGALVISIPVSIVAGVGRAARDGILIKGGEFLETTARIDTVALDKTGTLTAGRPELTRVLPLREDVTERDIVRWAALAEIGSEHPLARPILEAAEREGVSPRRIAEHTSSIPGKGIAATESGRRILVGNSGMMRDFGVSLEDKTLGGAETAMQKVSEEGQTGIFVALDGNIIGIVAVADRVRPGAAEMVRVLHDTGVSRVVMLTGDAEPVAHAVARQTGIDEVHAGLLPEGKLEGITRLQEANHTVAMVGDGVNDAPALATADIGVAMGAQGSAVAVETADIALMGDRLSRLPEAIHLAKRTVRNLHQNIMLAVLTVIFLLIGVLAGGVTMAIGMLVHEASVLVVVLNAMRLLRKRRG